MAKENAFDGRIRIWQRGLMRCIEQKYHNLERTVLRLNGASFQRVLERGFTLVTNKNTITPDIITIGSIIVLSLRMIDMPLRLSL